MEVSHKDVLPQSASAICKVTYFVVNGGGGVFIIERSIKAQAGCVSINGFFFFIVHQCRTTCFVCILFETILLSLSYGSRKMHLVISCL